MQRFQETLKAFNAEWNDLPRRLMWIVILIGCLFVALFAFPYLAPFILAAVFAWVINPAVNFFTRLFGGKKGVRSIVSAVFVLVLASLVLLLLFVLIGRVFGEIRNLAIALPGWISTASSDVIAWVEGLDFDWPALESGLEEAFLRVLSDAASMLTSLATRAASYVARGALYAASALPQTILFIVLTLMGTFYMSMDKDRIFTFLRSLLPEKYKARSTLYRASILRAILGQLRAGFIMLGVTFTELCIGFLLMRLDYAILFALIIAVLDALPVIGAGLFLIPMCLYGIVFGNPALAVGSGLIYLMTIIVRQLLEPRLIGRQLGLYPLATMMAMYAGLHAFGFLGMLLGPLMLLLCKVALTADIDDATEAATVKPMLGNLRRKKDKKK